MSESKHPQGIQEEKDLLSRPRSVVRGYHDNCFLFPPSLYKYRLAQQE